jgi:hypothetical protein
LILPPPTLPSQLPPTLVGAATSVLWEPQPGPQTWLVCCPVFEVFYGGARGGGKTDGSIGDWLLHSAAYGENAIGIFVRRKLTQLAEVIARTKQLFNKIGGKYNEQKKEWVMANGARLKFVYLERDSDAENYQGHNYTRVYIEEATNFPDPAPINKLKGTLRSANGVPCGMRLTGNPGGPGHHWVKARYIDNGPFNIIREEEDVDLGDGTIIKSFIERVFIPAKLKDNQKLLRSDPGYVQRLRQTGSAALVKAWLEGNWDEIEGTFFSEFSESLHVIKGRIEVPSHWTRFRAMDWGSARPFSIGWYAVSDGMFLPRGALLKYREWYGIETGLDGKYKPNTGLKMHAPAVARGILAREQNDLIAYGVADPSVFAENGGPSIAENMLIEGCHWLRADNARQPGWEQMRKMLLPDSEAESPRPLLYFHESCVHSIRTIPYLQHDDKDPEDLDTEGEDHAADETRYAIMSRTWVDDLPPIQTPSRGWTINQLIERQKAKDQGVKL